MLAHPASIFRPTWHDQLQGEHSMSIHLDLLKTLTGHGRDVNAVAFSPDDNLLASAGGDRTIRIWNVASQTLLQTLEHGEWVNSVAFAPQGNMIASAGRDGAIKIWSLESGQLLGTISAHPQNATAVLFNNDGSRLVSGGADGIICVFNLREKKKEASVQAHSGWVWRLQFSSLGDRLLSAGADRVARVWKMGGNEKPIELTGHEDEVLYASFSPDDRFIATSGKDGKVRFWESDSGRQLYSFTAHEGPVNSVNCSPDGIYLLTAGTDKNLRVWLTESGQLSAETTAGYDYIAESVFSHAGDRIASCGGDGTVKIWNLVAKGAYAEAGSQDPDLEIEHEDTPSRAGGYSSAYSAGQSLLVHTLSSGLKLSLLRMSGGKVALGAGEPPRTAAVAGNQLEIISGNGLPLLTLDLSTHKVIHDSTEGSAAPFEGETTDASQAAAGGPAKAGGDAPAARPLSGLSNEIERSSSAASNAYGDFDEHGELLARERLESGHVVRAVRFDANTLYILFDERSDPTIVVKSELMDVRDASKLSIFRLNLRTMEPVISRRGSIPRPASHNGRGQESQAARDPLLVSVVEESRPGNRARINGILSRAVWSGASDIHVPSGASIQIRKHGRLEKLNEPLKSPAEIESMLLEILNDTQRQRFTETNDLDFSYEITGVARFRANVCRQHRGVDGSFRIILEAIPSLEQLGLPPSVPPLTNHHQGLVLITGPAGRGKSTTIASLVDLINSEKPLHIITVEDPIEFVHPIKRAVVNQREVGNHTLSFANALRAALREDPDVIVVGEMRDLETISLAITAAETGHLVFGSLMTTDASQTVDRILDSFPAGQQAQVRTMLSESLKGIVSQQLIPAADGSGRVLACEVLLCNLAVANMIRERKTFQLGSILQTGRNQGMQRMDDSLFDLFQAGRVTAQSVMLYSHDPKAMEPRLRTAGGQLSPGMRAR
jgi:twitching motility protein PilT